MIRLEMITPHSKIVHAPKVNENKNTTNSQKISVDLKILIFFFLYSLVFLSLTFFIVTPAFLPPVAML